ncbi:MAG: RteC domain-containing protein [Sphingobacterium sp.]
MELVYALHLLSVFDNGKTDIKVNGKTFERTFDIDLGDFYHTFMELNTGKINQINSLIIYGKL